jgi:trans-aconitate methyltransferase
MAIEIPPQQWNSRRYSQNARFVSNLGEPVVELLNPQPGERILDLACGDGALTEKIIARGAEVVGVDGSADMVAAAQKRGVDARVVDAYQLDFTSEFDGVFSNAALHWMKRDPDAVIQGVRRALKPGGRFVAEMGGHGNVAAINVALCATLENHGVKDPAAILPWYYPSPEEYRERLKSAGFETEYIELIPRPTPLPTGMRGWLETYVSRLTQSLPKESREVFLDEVTERLRPVLCDSADRWTADYVRLRFRTRLPGN